MQTKDQNLTLISNLQEGRIILILSEIVAKT